MNNKNNLNLNGTERVPSVALGTVLLRKSVKKFDLFFSLSSLYLVYRGYVPTLFEKIREGKIDPSFLLTHPNVVK